jgi:hypothetical protein
VWVAQWEYRAVWVIPSRVTSEQKHKRIAWAQSKPTTQLVLVPALALVLAPAQALEWPQSQYLPPIRATVYLAQSEPGAPDSRPPTAIQLQEQLQAERQVRAVIPARVAVPGWVQARARPIQRPVPLIVDEVADPTR